MNGLCLLYRVEQAEGGCLWGCWADSKSQQCFGSGLIWPLVLPQASHRHGKKKPLGVGGEGTFIINKEECSCPSTLLVTSSGSRALPRAVLVPQKCSIRPRCPSGGSVAFFWADLCALHSEGMAHTVGEGNG